MKIKRPLFIISFSILVVIYAINTMPRSTIMFSLALFALFILVHRRTKDRHTMPMVLSFIAAMAGMVYFEIYNIRLHDKLSYLSQMESATVTGEIVNEGQTSATAYYTVDIDTVNGKKYSGLKVIVYTDDIFEYGTQLQMSGKFKGFTPKSNYLYNYSRGIFGYFYPDEYEILKDKSTFNLYLGKVRKSLVDASRTIFDYRTVPMAVAMGLGDKSLLTDSTVNAFNFTGISHALVVSGLHVGFIVGVITALLNIFPLHKKVKNIIAAFLVFLFMGIIGFSPSIIRAGCLIICILLGRNFLLEIDNYTVLSMIILITILQNPYTANNASLLLSYSAYFGVVHSIDISTGKEYGKIKSSLLMTVFAVLYTLPIMSMLGMEVTLLSPLFNLLLSPVVMVICIFSFFLPVIYHFGVVGRIICIAMAPVNEFFIDLLMSVTEFSRSNLGFAMVDLSDERILFMIFATLIAVAVTYIHIENVKIRKMIIFIVPVLSFLCYNYLNKDIVTVKVFDGSSEPSYIISSAEKNYLVMTEEINQRRFKTVLESQNITAFDEIITCPEKEFDTEFYTGYTDRLTVINDSKAYINEIFAVSSVVEKRNMTYVIDLSDVKIAFNHKRADLTDIAADFYFFGSDTPRDFNAEHCYYFYPVIKANSEMVVEKEAVELYDILTIKINIASGEYNIVKDVKNFGGQL